MESTQVVIVGGGATGAGVLWDLTLRGIPAMLLEQADIANGATGRCHGLLHSGGRYVVKDLETARDCLAENRIVKTIAAHCVEDIGGLFVQLPEDDPSFFEKWWSAAQQAGIPHATFFRIKTRLQDAGHIIRDRWDKTWSQASAPTQPN